MIAVELDAALAADLREQFAAEPRIEVVTADFLRYDLPRTPYKLFGNIPFAVTSAIVRRVTEAEPPPVDAHLIMQREAAEKLAGSPWAPESRRSLTLKPRCRWRSSNAFAARTSSRRRPSIRCCSRSPAASDR